MLKQYIGKNRAENLDWLLKVWVKGGPPVCFLQGFSGVGKTDLARDFKDLAAKQSTCQGAVLHEITDRPTPDVLESFMELSSVLSQQGLPEMEEVLFNQPNPNLAFALERVLRRPVVIIIDEAERFFHSASGKPLPEMDGILKFLGNRRDLPGRLLLFSDRTVEWSHGSEWIPKRTLHKLEPDEALEALDTKMKEAGVTGEIPLERKKDVVRALDFNPRAIEALVGALFRDTLDDIIQSDPGLWAVQDREVSRDFIRELEHRLLERTLRHLEDVHQRRLWRLAVHRRSFKREALERVCGTKDEVSELRSVLEARFLLNFYRGALTLNPIVREIALAHLRDEPAEFRQAHSGAADYHMRHFTAKQIVVNQSKLGESFAELRYHLVQAGREAELPVIGQRFTDHLKQEIKSVSPVPTDAEELDERIGVLTVLLGNAGAKGLEYHLARCLQSRGKAGDIHQAVIHAERALGHGAPSDAWYLLANLKRQSETPEAAIAIVRRGIKELKNPDLTAPLYQLGAEILSGANKTDEAVALLKEGIQVIPPDKNLFSLYQISADLLAKAGKTDEAVALLKEGIKVIPPDKNLFSLYQTLGEVHCRAGDVEAAIASQREGIQRIPEQFGRYSLANGLLYFCAASGKASVLSETLSATGGEIVGRPASALGTVLQKQLQDDWEGAAQLAKTARVEFPRYTALALHEAFSHLAARGVEPAWEALKRIPNLNLGRVEPISWLAAFIHLRRGARAEASAALATYLSRPVDEGRELNEAFLLRLWDQQEIAPESNRLCFHFPIMPASLTGLSHPIRRVQFGKPVLPMQAAAAPAGVLVVPPTGSPDEPEVYVSYAWGDDTSPEGIKREEVVNQMCVAVGRTGRVVGRDKTVMKPGDSIDAFADKIAKAPRIVAVISAKSLHSKFCMVDEIYSAYQRSGFQRAEFQSKVVALVMDDATALLKDDIALVKHWKAVHEQERDGLKAVDPHNKALERWSKIHKLGDMCDHLLDMLDAIKDIIMLRGYENIVQGNFQEVIDRLPPRRN